MLKVWTTVAQGTLLAKHLPPNHASFALLENLIEEANLIITQGVGSFSGTRKQNPWTLPLNITLDADMVYYLVGPDSKANCSGV
jgi:hypothetical protein